MTEIDLETAVIVTDREHRLYGEVGMVRNSWPATFFPARRIYSVEIGGFFHELHESQIAALVCPDCGHEWDESMRPCPNCGLTIETIVERTLAR